MRAPLEPIRRHLHREWWWLAAAWLLLGVLLGVDFWRQHRDIEAREREHLAQQAAMLHDHLAAQLNGVNHAMDSLLAELPRWNGQPGGPARLALSLRSYADAMPAVDRISLLDARGVVVASSASELLGRDFGERDDFLAARRGAQPGTLVVSAPFKGAAGHWVVVLARVVAGRDGSFQGVLAATLDTNYFRTLLPSMRYAPDMLVSLAHGDGRRFVASGRADEAEGVDLDYPGSPLMRHLRGGQPASLLLGSMRPGDSLRQLVALRTLQPGALRMDRPLVVAVGRDWGSIFADWRGRLARVAAGYLLAGVAAGLAVAWLQRRERLLLRQQQLLAAREAENQMRWDAVLEATEQGLWDYEVAQDKAYRSPVWLSMLGYAPGEVEETRAGWESRIHPDDQAGFRAAWRAFLEGGGAEFECVHRLRCRDGSYKWCMARARAIARDAAGRPARVLGTLSDVGEQRRRDEMLQRLAENVPGALYQYQLEPDGRSHFPYASPQVLDIYGFTPEELRRDATLVFGRVHPDDLAPGMENLRKSARELSEWNAEYRFELPGRGQRWLAGHARPQRLASGAVLWYGYVNDVTEVKEQALKLQATERMLQQLMSDMPVALCMVDERLRIYFRNQRFLDDFGWTEQEVPTLREWALRAYPDPAYRDEAARRWRQAKAQARAGHVAAQSFRIAARDGSCRVMDIAGLVFGERLLVTFQDRTEQQAQNEWLRRMAYMDGLTGIANRRSFDEALQSEWSRCSRSGQPLSLLMMDIDHFKAYNDRYGHQKGDECLQEVARALRGVLGRPHDMVARYGGEEFVCLLPVCDLAGAHTVAQALLRAVRDLALVHEGSSVAPVVTVSIGVASEVPRADEDPTALVKCADDHLYRAKTTGCNKAVGGPDVQSKT